MQSRKPTTGIKSAVRKGASSSLHGYIDYASRDLYSEDGAKEVIGLISPRRVVTKLILGHNELGDEGCEKLFEFLSSPRGRRYALAEISLNSNGISNRGLLSICRYVKGATHLKELFLHDNLFVADSNVTSALVDALHNSSIELLALNSNASLSDEFVTNFLPSLNAPHLKELHLSSMNLSLDSAQAIADFISCRSRCRLRTLKCNGNNLGIRGVSTIARAVERHNYSLMSVEFYANRLADGSLSDEDDSDRSGTGQAQWSRIESLLKRVLSRNEYLKRQTERQALSLLRHSRTFLSRPTAESSSSQEASQYPRIPTELQLHIFSFLAPDLSPSQRIRVFDYASSTKTLPRLLPRLQASASSECVPDPTSLDFAEEKIWELEGGGGGHKGGGCANGKCMGGGNSLVCRREQQRQKWLTAVGCDSYDPVDSNA